MWKARRDQVLLVKLDRGAGILCWICAISGTNTQLITVRYRASYNLIILAIESSYSGPIAANQRAVHALNRLAFGPRPGDLDEVRRGGVEKYIRCQLNPESISESPELRQRIAALPTLKMTPVELFEQFKQPIDAAKGDKDAQKQARRQARTVITEAVQARILRAIYEPRQLQEVMTAFWFNHFNVFSGKGLCSLWTGAFEEEAIRPHTMGRFRDLLGATAKHPAMLFYLDNWQNTAPDAPGSHRKFDGINENYAREVMELHTLGVNGGYTQQDVIALAHIFTGWSIVPERPAAQARMAAQAKKAQERSAAPIWRPYRPMAFGSVFPGWFGARAVPRVQPSGGMRGQARQQNPDPARMRNVSGPYGFMFYGKRHDFADKTFLGNLIEGRGIGEGEQALDMLASSPATANHLSYELVQYFVADEPPRSLVNRMAARYLASGGNFRDVLEALFSSAEFWDQRNYGIKFKTPYEYVISAVRAAGVDVINVNPLAGAMAGLGMPLYGCQTPDGYRNTQEAWLNPDAMMLRLSFATALGRGHLQLELPVDGENDGPMARNAVLAMESNPAPDPIQLAMTVGDLFSERTAGVIEGAAPGLRAPLILGSPEFMMR
jgi:uncharacterized protein (DUF1800 family)